MTKNEKKIEKKAEKKQEQERHPKNIHEAILYVYEQVGYVQKGGKVAFGKTRYSYAGEADLIRALRPAMTKAGVLFYPIKIDILDQNTTKSKCQYTFRFQHAHSDTYIDVPAIGEGIDQGDKASYKAATGAMKYALRQTFVIETGDDPDKTSSDEIEEKKLIDRTPPKPAKPTEDQWVDGVNKIKALILESDSVIDTAHNLRHRIDKVRTERPDLFKIIDDAIKEKMDKESASVEDESDVDNSIDVQI